MALKLPLEIDLNAEQAAAVNAALRGHPGGVLMGKVSRVWMNGDPTHDARAGALFLEVGIVPESALDGMRRAIAEAREYPNGRPRKKAKA